MGDKLNDKIKIVSDGTDLGTKVIYKGLVLPCVKKIELDLEVNSEYQAKITFVFPKSVECEVEKSAVKAFIEELKD